MFKAMLTTALIILAIAAPITAGILFILRRKSGLTLGGEEIEHITVKPERPCYVDENVLFTVYRPKVLAPDEWYTLLAFAHLAEKRPGAPAHSPHPAAEVRRIAERFYGSRAPEQMITQQQSAGSIPESGALTFVPRAEGVEFNPEEVTIKWLRDVHHANFEMMCSAEAEGQTLRGALTVYAGPFILADVPFAFEVDRERAAASSPGEVIAEPPAAPYDKIFASYSHKDVTIVEKFEAHVEALGHHYLRDVYALRSGEAWGEAVMRLIDEAQVFQLFWSRNSMQSEFVRQEWEHALSLRRPNFVRPVYWEEPLPKTEELPPEALARIHFHKYKQTEPVRSSEDAESERFRGWDFLNTMRSPAGMTQVLVLICFVGLALIVFESKSVRNWWAHIPGNPTPTPSATPLPTPIIGSQAQDTALKNIVEANLTKYGVTGVEVEVDNGEVTLKGNVPRAKWHDAMKAANEAYPKRVNNQLNGK